MTIQPERPTSNPSKDVRQNRLNLLNLAIETAREQQPCPFDRLHRFERARIDVLVDAVLDRTLSALEEASDYLLDKGVL